MSINVTHTTTRYTFTVTAPAGEPFVLDDRGTQMVAESIDFEVSTDNTGTLCTVGVHFVAHGHPRRGDGTLSRSKRTMQGGNLKRIPIEVRLALQEGIREAVGSLHDPLGQLNGYDAR